MFKEFYSGIKSILPPELNTEYFKQNGDYYGHEGFGRTIQKFGDEYGSRRRSDLFNRLDDSLYRPVWETYQAAADELGFASANNTRPRPDQDRQALARDRRNDRRYREGLQGAIQKDGRVRLSHFSDKPITRTNPKFAGTGLDILKHKQLPEVTYFGITKTNENGYRREVGLGVYENIVTIEPTALYPADSDPLGLWAENDWDYPAAIQRMKDAGFSGS